MDATQLLESCMDDQEFVKELLECFVLSFNNTFKTINDSISNNSYSDTSLYKHFHSIKSSAKQIYYQEIVDLAAAVELQLKHTVDLDNVTRNLNQIKKLVDNINII